MSYLYFNVPCLPVSDTLINIMRGKPTKSLLTEKFSNDSIISMSHNFSRIRKNQLANHRLSPTLNRKVNGKIK